MSQKTHQATIIQKKPHRATGLLGRIFRTREIGMLAALLVLGAVALVLDEFLREPVYWI